MGQDAGSRNWGDMGIPEQNEIRKGENHRHLGQSRLDIHIGVLEGKKLIKH